MNGHQVDVIVIELSNAFDTVNLNMLRTKLKHFDIYDPILF